MVNTSGQYQAIAGRQKMKGKPKMKKMPKMMGRGQQKVPDYAMSGPGRKMKKGKGVVR